MRQPNKLLLKNKQKLFYVNVSLNVTFCLGFNKSVCIKKKLKKIKKTTLITDLDYKLCL